MSSIENRISRVRQQVKETERVEKTRKEAEERERKRLEKLRKKEVRDLLQRKIEPYLAKIRELEILELLEELRSIEQKQRFKLKHIKPRGEHPDSKVRLGSRYKLITPNSPQGKVQKTIFKKTPSVHLDNEDYQFDIKDLDVEIDFVSASFSWNVVSFGVSDRIGESIPNWKELEISFNLLKDEEGRWQLTLNDEPINQLGGTFLEESLAQKFVETNDPWL